MSTSRIFTWLAAGVIGVGSSAVMAQAPADDAQQSEEPRTIEQREAEDEMLAPQAFEEQATDSEAEQLRSQVEQQVEQAYRQHGIEQQEAQQAASDLADDVEQHRKDIQESIQQTLQDQGQLDEQQARTESERISRQIARELSQFAGEGEMVAPAGVDQAEEDQPEADRLHMEDPEQDQQLQQEEQEQLQQPLEADAFQEEMAADDAEQQTLRGTIVDAAKYLVHGEEAVREGDLHQPLGEEGQQDGQLQQEQQFQQEQQAETQDQSKPLVLLTEDGEAYLILERPEEQGVQRPLGEPADIEQDQQQWEVDGLQQEQQFQEDSLQDQQQLQSGEEEQRVTQPDRLRAPIRERTAPRVDHGVREQTAEAQQEPRRWQRHPGEWYTDESAEQQDTFADPQEAGEPEAIDAGVEADVQIEAEDELVQPEELRERGVYQQLELGQEVSLTGEVHERSGLRAIVIDQYGIEHDGGMQQPQEIEVEQDETEF